MEKSLSRSDGHVPEKAASAVLFDLVSGTCSCETILFYKESFDENLPLKSPDGISGLNILKWRLQRARSAGPPSLSCSVVLGPKPSERENLRLTRRVNCSESGGE